MTADLLLIGLLGGIVAVDTTEFGQFMISLPVFSAVVLGFILNNVETGLFLGILMVLPWLKLIPAGGALHHHGNIGCFTAAATALITLKYYTTDVNSTIFLSVLYAIVLSSTAGRLVYFKRSLNEKIVR